MKILIITYSRETNPGTFLQAYGVQYTFKKMYPSAQIDLIRHKRGYSVLKESKAQNGRKGWMTFVKAKLRAIPRRLKYEWAYKTKFHLTGKEFDFFDYDENEFKEFAEQYDLIIVGSDTILIQLERNGHMGLMWLKDVNTRKVLFAASAAPANYDISEHRKKQLLESFSSFELLGVRDRVTQRLLTEEIGLGKKVYIQYDPTYLIPDECFKLSPRVVDILESKRKNRKIALVNFSVTGCPFKKELTEFLKQEGFFTVSTLYNEDADLNLMSLSPFEWGALFRYIDMAITERFHDSVFTLRNGKPVVAVDWATFRFSSNGFSKTQDLLELYGLEENHFIATNQIEAKAVMEHFKSIDIDKQRESICVHNQKVYSEYESIMNNVMSVIAPEKVVKIGGGMVKIYNQKNMDIPAKNKPTGKTAGNPTCSLS